MESILNRDSKTKEIFLNIGLLAFPFLLPLPLPLNIKSFAFIVFLITLFFNGPKNTQSIKHTLKNRIVILFIALYFLDPILSLLRGDGLYFRDLRISFLVAPFVFLLGKDVLLSFKDKIFKVFTVGAILYIIFSVGYIVYFYSQSKMHDFAVGYYLKYISYHHMPNSIQHTYLGIYICLATAIVLFNAYIHKTIKIVICLLFFLSVFVLASKLSIAFFIIVICFYLFQNLRLSKSILIGIVISIITTVSFILSYLIYDTDLFRTFDNSLYKRIHIYICSLKGIVSNFFVGIGNKNIKLYINNCNNEIGYMDTHNMLLQEFLSNGVIGFILLLFLLFMIFKKIFKSKSNLGYILLLSIIVFGSVEHIFNLQHGMLFYMFFLLLIYVLSVSN